MLSKNSKRFESQNTDLEIHILCPLLLQYQLSLLTAMEILHLINPKTNPQNGFYKGGTLLLNGFCAVYLMLL